MKTPATIPHRVKRRLDHDGRARSGRSKPGATPIAPDKRWDIAPPENGDGEA
jgi:hypothetical protein